MVPQNKHYSCCWLSNQSQEYLKCSLFTYKRVHLNSWCKEANLSRLPPSLQHSTQCADNSPLSFQLWRLTIGSQISKPTPQLSFENWIKVKSTILPSFTLTIHCYFQPINLRRNFQDRTRFVIQVFAVFFIKLIRLVFLVDYHRRLSKWWYYYC